MRARKLDASRAAAISALVMVCMAAAACAGGSNTPDSGSCGVNAPTTCPDPVPHYADVEPIFQSRCVLCHTGLAEIWALNTYDHVVTWHDEIRSAMLTCAMPPPDAGVPVAIEERLAILTWIRCGMAQ